MKNLLSLLVAATAALAFTSTPAEARNRHCGDSHHSRSYHRSSHCAPRYCAPRPIYRAYCPPVYCEPVYPVRPAYGYGYGYIGYPSVRLSFGFAGRGCRW